MKAYPSIGTLIDPTQSYHVFDKLDGSNLRAEWTPKLGFHRFGSRTQLLTSEQTVLYPAIAAFLSAYGDALHERFAQARFAQAIAFFEYAGPHSFSGQHADPPEAMTPTLFDIAAHRKGLLPPEAFLALADGLHTPKLLHQGLIDDDFITAVRTRMLPGMTFEGVIGKGPYLQRLGGPVQFKLKSQDWLDRLRHQCGDDEGMFERLR